MLTRPAKGLVDESNAPLLTPKFWAQAIYTELLHASSRFRAVREQEQKRPPNGLVKVVCLSYDGTARMQHERKKESGAYFESMIGTNSWVGSMFDASNDKNSPKNSLVGGKGGSSGRCCLY